MSITKTEIAAIAASIATVATAVGEAVSTDNADWLTVLVPAVIAAATKIASAFQAQAAVKKAAASS